MRINQFVAKATGVSRRRADKIIDLGLITINDLPANAGSQVQDSDTVKYRSKVLKIQTTQTIMLNKPVGHVCSRNGQGSQTIYSLLPPELHHLKPVGRLDKDSSGLLLLTNDGKLAHELTHPSFKKEKVYEVKLDKNLSENDFEIITKQGVQLEDGPSKFKLDFINDRNDIWKVTMSEGRNRQIRRTFEKLGYDVIKLHRTKFGKFSLGQLALGDHELVD